MQVIHYKIHASKELRKYSICKKLSGAVTKVKLITKTEKHNQIYFGTLILVLS